MQKESTSFLKKRSKKLLIVLASGYLERAGRQRDFRLASAFTAA
jgi:hypothetical protein